MTFPADFSRSMGTFPEMKFRMRKRHGRVFRKQIEKW
jgi:hypothetical protein